MKKVLMLAALVAAAASFLAISTGSASADGAVVTINDPGPGCVFLDIDGVGGFFDADARRQTVTTPSGGSLTTCKGTWTGAAPAKAVVQSGFPCFTTVGTTTDSKQVITPSGKVTLSCHNNV